MEIFTNVSVRNYSYMFNFEKEFLYQEKIEWMVQNWTQAFYYSILYICIIFGTKWYMQDKPRYRLRTLLILWNLGLTAFSLMALLRTAPEFIHIITNHGFYYSVCSTSFIKLDRVSSFWSWCVILSKLIELGDTVFIVLRKQPLIILHWYHHIMTLVIVWYGYKEIVPSARWFMVMNLFIHSMMYFYYALRAMGYSPPRKISMFLTTAQIIQMIIGCGINIYVYNLLTQNIPCGVSYKIMNMTFSIYLSYLMLFANFFYRSYIVGKKKAKPDIKSEHEINGNNWSSSKTKVQ